MDSNLKDCNTLFFCDESKFSKRDGDFEDEIYYFAVPVSKDIVAKVDMDFKLALKKHKVQASTFHSTTIFKESRPRENLMKDICEIFISNRLHCFCFKYLKPLLYEPTKVLSQTYDNDIFKFKDSEFQALFYFLIVFNTNLRDNIPKLFEKDYALFFDRNVYGDNEIESFQFPHEQFVIKHMTFTEKSQVSLLALPDFFGYIFRKSKKSQNKVQHGIKDVEKSKLVINSFSSLLKIKDENLFHFLDIDYGSMSKALELFNDDKKQYR